MSVPGWLAIVADAASVASLGVTGIVWFQTRQIKRSIMRNARVPDALRDLERFSELFRQNLKDWPEREREANVILAQADSVLINVLPKLAGAEKGKIQKPQLLIRRRTAILRGWARKPDPIRHNAYWDIYESLVGATEALRQLNADYKKRI
jgi:hypothetical protein